MPETKSVEALVLRVVPYGERDVIVTLVGRGLGRFNAFGRGLRTSTKRFPGGLELFCLYRVDVRSSGARLPTLMGAEALTNLPGYSASLERLALGSCALELVREMLPEDEAHDTVLDGLWHVLLQLHRLPDEDLARQVLTLRWFELQLLGVLGFAPAFQACFRCGCPTAQTDALAFSFSGGGVLCARCVEPADEAAEITSALVRGMTRLVEEPLPVVLDGAARRLLIDGVGPLEAFNRLCGRLTTRLIERAVARPLKSYAFFDKLR